MICFSGFDQFNKPGCINPDVQRQTIEALLTSEKSHMENVMTPQFMKLPPPLHIANDEVMYILCRISNFLLCATVLI